MIVVADSGPLHYLILLDQTELLERLYGQIVVPQAVSQELTSQKAPRPVKDWISRPPSWCRIESVPPDRLELITGDLDLGEREAIALAHLLRAAAERNWLDIPETLARLRETTFYVEESLIRAVFGEWLGEGDPKLY